MNQRTIARDNQHCEVDVAYMSLHMMRYRLLYTLWTRTKKRTAPWPKAGRCRGGQRAQRATGKLQKMPFLKKIFPCGARKGAGRAPAPPNGVAVGPVRQKLQMFSNAYFERLKRVLFWFFQKEIEKFWGCSRKYVDRLHASFKNLQSKTQDPRAHVGPMAMVGESKNWRCALSRGPPNNGGFCEFFDELWNSEAAVSTLMSMQFDRQINI